MARLSQLIAALVLGAAVFTAHSLPTVRKESDSANNGAPKAAEASAALEAELGKLKQDGVAVQKSEHTVSKIVNGKKQTSKTEKETVTDVKTGEVVATASKTVTKDESGQKKEEAHVDVPAAGIHQDMSGAEAENFELLPADDVARYIFDTSDIDGVKTAVQTLVEKKKISKKAADSYIQEIRQHLNTMHEDALREVTAELEERRKEEDAAYKDMLNMAETLNANADTEKALYLYAKKLYAAYRTEGDEYAKEILTQFTNLLQQESESGNLDESVQDNIYDIILKALKDVNDELQPTDGADDAAAAVTNDAAPATQNDNAKSKLPKD